MSQGSDFDGLDEEVTAEASFDFRTAWEIAQSELDDANSALQRARMRIADFSGQLDRARSLLTEIAALVGLPGSVDPLRLLSKLRRLLPTSEFAEGDEPRTALYTLRQDLRAELEDEPPPSA